MSARDVRHKRMLAAGTGLPTAAQVELYERTVDLDYADLLAGHLAAVARGVMGLPPPPSEWFERARRACETSGDERHDSRS
jgi:hypothetical protein